jgi:hypothetical protein
MTREKKNKIKYFYQIISDIKNNIDTLIKELYKNQNDLEGFSRTKPVILKSKYPDLKKLNILKKTDKWEITDIGREILNIYGKGDEEEYHKIIANIIGTYNFNGFRPYAVLCKFLYIKFGLDNYFDRKEIAKFLSLPINEAIYFINNEDESSFKEISEERITVASRPYSYGINYLVNAGLIIIDEEGIKLNNNIKEFLEIFFSEIELIPKKKTQTSLNKYRIIGRGNNQVDFRNELLEVYKGRCGLSGKLFVFKENNLLEAAHIIPVSHGGSYEVNNGILMTSDLHKAFDSGAITFDEEYRMIIHSGVEEENYLPNDKKINHLPDNKNNYPSLESINYHRKYIYGIGVINSKSLV